jgi:hypothetical protein
MAEYIIQDSTLTDIADAIRAKDGSSAPILTEDMADAIAAIPSGGGYDGLELISVDPTTDKPSAWKWHGKSIPNYACYYMMYNSNVFPEIDLSEVENIGNYGLSNSPFRPKNVQNIKTLGSYCFSVASGSGAGDLSSASITFSELTGKRADGTIPDSVFRVNNAYYYQKIFLPKFQYIGAFTFYQRKVANSEVVLGSIGYPILVCDRQPFNGSSGVGVVTVYTTGALLDTIKTAMQNGASANYTFIYKAAEATEYGGVSYAAGDTMLTVGGA